MPSNKWQKRDLTGTGHVVAERKSVNGIAKVPGKLKAEELQQDGDDVDRIITMVNQH